MKSFWKIYVKTRSAYRPSGGGIEAKLLSDLVDRFPDYRKSDAVCELVAEHGDSKVNEFLQVLEELDISIPDSVADHSCGASIARWMEYTDEEKASAPMYILNPSMIIADVGDDLKGRSIVLDSEDLRKNRLVDCGIISLNAGIAVREGFTESIGAARLVGFDVQELEFAEGEWPSDFGPLHKIVPSICLPEVQNRLFNEVGEVFPTRSQDQFNAHGAYLMDGYYGGMQFRFASEELIAMGEWDIARSAELLGGIGFLEPAILVSPKAKGALEDIGFLGEFFPVGLPIITD